MPRLPGGSRDLMELAGTSLGEADHRTRVPRHDEAPGRHQGQSSSNYDASKTTADLPLALVWRAVPRIFDVIAGSGRHRFLLLYKCPYCGGNQHAAHARVLRSELRRKTSCKLGVIVLMTYVEQVAG
jgi:hypothetical protein